MSSVLLLYCLCSAPLAFSQNYLFDVAMIGVEDGLPHRNTNSVVQDNEGFIWVSTIGAISRYDGYHFKTYTHPFLNISESNAAHLAVDALNRLWYCEDHNNAIYSGVIDTRSDTVYSMEEISKGRFTSKDVLYIHNSRTNSEDIFIETRSGRIYKYNDHFEEIYRFPHRLSSPLLCEGLPDGSYWMIYEDNAILVKHKKIVKTLKIIGKDEGVKGIKRIVSTTPHLILEFYGHLANRYWILKKDTLVPFTIKGHAPGAIKGVFQQHKAYTIYTTKDTLFIRDNRGKTLYASNAFEFFMFGQNRGYQSPLLDRQNILWIPTESGLLKITVRKTFFEILEPGNSIRGIFKDNTNFWVGGYSRNVVKNTITKSEHIFFPFPIAGSSFYKDDQGHLWIGTSSRYLREYISDEMYKDYFLNFDYFFYLIFQNPITKTYWTGSNNGVLRFDRKKKTVVPFPLPIASENLHIRQFYPNAQGIWIVTNKGIFLMDAEEETIVKHYTTADGLPTDNMNHLYEDAAGIFWIGTKSGGLVRWDLTDNSVTQYTQQNGLSNNNIYAVYEDDYQTLWLPSDYGLMAFDKNTAVTKVYLPESGIAHEEFNTYAHFKDKDGNLYFGGLNGITKFHPKDLQKKYEGSTPLYATRVHVLEKDAEKFIDKTAVYLDDGKIDLQSSDRILKVELTLLDYENSIENQYAYQLTQHHNQWVYTDTNTLSIINPPYGRYNLIVKARGASGCWSDMLLKIPIYRPLPFYRQWWFILGVTILIVLAIVGAIKQRVQHLKKERKHLEVEVQKRTQKIAKQTEALKVLHKVKNRFFTNITHEFRTPLTLITGPTEQMLAGNIPESLKISAQTIHSNAQHLLELVNQLLDISRLESGKIELKVSTTDVIAFVRKRVQGMQLLADERQQQLIFTTALQEWKTHFDTEKLGRIVYNVLSNAIKYTPDKGRIELSLFKKQKEGEIHIEIWVKDTGIGIAKDALLHIFDRFYQVDSSTTRKNEGTGIGLSLVKELVELQNGKISVESTLGKGSIFTVTLPVLPPPLHPDTDFEAFRSELSGVPYETEAFSAEKQANGISRKHKMELLIIEDNAQMRRYIRSCIDTSVYNISEADNGEEGIAKAKEIVPDLIISDIMMPGKNGFEVTMAVRNDLATSHIPVILLTARTSQDSKLNGLAYGADAYLTKPFSPQELTLRIKKLIEIRQLIQKRYRSLAPMEADAIFQKEDHFITRLKNYITEHISDPELNGELISRHFSMSRMQLHRKLKAILDSDVSSYIRTVRLDMALRLLKERRLKIAEVAYETGFSSPDHFSRSFKKAYGKPPSKI